MIGVQAERGEACNFAASNNNKRNDDTLTANDIKESPG